MNLVHCKISSEILLSFCDISSRFRRPSCFFIEQTLGLGVTQCVMHLPREECSSIFVMGNMAYMLFADKMCLLK
jgi:hypothetical protein